MQLESLSGPFVGRSRIINNYNIFVPVSGEGFNINFAFNPQA